MFGLLFARCWRMFLFWFSLLLFVVAYLFTVVGRCLMVLDVCCMLCVVFVSCLLFIDLFVAC